MQLHKIAIKVLGYKARNLRVMVVGSIVVAGVDPGDGNGTSKL